MPEHLIFVVNLCQLKIYQIFYVLFNQNFRSILYKVSKTQEINIYQQETHRYPLFVMTIKL